MAQTDPRLASLLKWSIENSTSPDNPTASTSTSTSVSVANPTSATTSSGPATTQSTGSEATQSIGNEATPSTGNEAPQTSNANTSRPPNAAALQALFGGPSDAELMRTTMAALTSTTEPLGPEARRVAFDNLEQLLESLDNSNNLGPLGLWPGLVGLLNDASDAETRALAADCMATAVQNNRPSQEQLLASGALPTLVRLARHGDPDGAHGKGNGPSERQKARRALSSLVRNFQPALDAVVTQLGHKENLHVDAGDMDAVTEFIKGLDRD